MDTNKDGALSGRELLLTLLGLIAIAAGSIVAVNIWAPAQADSLTPLIGLIGTGAGVLLLMLQQQQIKSKVDVTASAVDDVKAQVNTTVQNTAATNEQLVLVAKNVDGNLTHLREQQAALRLELAEASDKLSIATAAANLAAGHEAGRKEAVEEATTAAAAAAPPAPTEGDG